MVLKKQLINNNLIKLNFFNNINILILKYFIKKGKKTIALKLLLTLYKELYKLKLKNSFFIIEQSVYNLLIPILYKKTFTNLRVKTMLYNIVIYKTLLVTLKFSITKTFLMKKINSFIKQLAFEFILLNKLEGYLYLQRNLLLKQLLINNF